MSTLTIIPAGIMPLAKKAMLMTFVDRDALSPILTLAGETVIDTPIEADAHITSLGLMANAYDGFDETGNLVQIRVYDKTNDAFLLAGSEPLVLSHAHTGALNFSDLPTPLAIKAGQYVGLRLPKDLTTHGGELPGLTAMTGEGRYRCLTFAPDADKLDLASANVANHDWPGWCLTLD